MNVNTNPAPPLSEDGGTDDAAILCVILKETQDQLQAILDKNAILNCLLF